MLRTMMIVTPSTGSRNRRRRRRRCQMNLGRYLGETVEEGHGSDTRGRGGGIGKDC